jgi:hypothetical protein
MGPEPLCTLWRRQKPFARLRNRTLAIQTVVTPIELSVTMLNPIYCALVHALVLNDSFPGYEKKTFVMKPRSDYSSKYPTVVVFLILRKIIIDTA